MRIVTMSGEFRQYGKVSNEDLWWLSLQEPCVMRLWIDCMYAEKFGQSFNQLITMLSHNSFNLAKNALEERGLFEFRPITQKTKAGRYKTIGWEVKNLHGSKNKDYWNQPESEKNNLS